MSLDTAGSKQVPRLAYAAACSPRSAHFRPMRAHARPQLWANESEKNHGNSSTLIQSLKSSRCEDVSILPRHSQLTGSAFTAFHVCRGADGWRDRRSAQMVVKLTTPKDGFYPWSEENKDVVDISAVKVRCPTCGTGMIYDGSMQVWYCPKCRQTPPKHIKH